MRRFLELISFELNLSEINVEVLLHLLLMHYWRINMYKESTKEFIQLVMNEFLPLHSQFKSLSCVNPINMYVIDC